jgi:Concanavalin A-like lectin/glucanases superfamily
MPPRICILVVSFIGIALSLGLADTLPAHTTWNVADFVTAPSTRVKLYGNPKVSEIDSKKCVVFNGKNDSLTIEENPFSGATSFTIQVLVKPDSTGQPAQRFIHLEDKDLRRLMVELRLAGNKSWAMDTFLHSDKGDHPLLDMTYLHSADTWHWACLVYDGHTMTSYIDGIKELSFDLPFSLMREGRVAIGSRLNHVYWFKGAISVIEFDRRALMQSELHHVDH